MADRAELGLIAGCIACSHQCGFGCCHQSLPHESDYGPQNSILLYPGECEAAPPERRRHILVTTADFHGGKLGYCDRNNFDQSTCSARRNFKPLDCQSYLFFPAIKDDALILKIDRRCPLARETLREHYRQTLERWTALVASNPSIETWIAGIALDGYEDFCPIPDW